MHFTWRIRKSRRDSNYGLPRKRMWAKKATNRALQAMLILLQESSPASFFFNYL
jgi:hypothetical protein